MPRSRVILLSVLAGVTLLVVLGFAGVAAVQFGQFLGGALLSQQGETAPNRDAPATEEDRDFGIVDIYDVDEQGALVPAATGTAADVWNLFTRIVGDDVAGASILQYKTGDAPESDTLAYVYQDSDPQYWTLVVNLDTANDPQLLIATLVHEYAHVFSYAPEQFEPKGGSCPTFTVVEGCAEEASYLWQFYEEFWTGYSEHPDLENTDGDVAWEFYQRHEEDFVSDYAATNIGEDFAESFMTFVLEESWSTETVAGRKLDFFTNYPELVELREHVRDELAVELGLR